MLTLQKINATLKCRGEMLTDGEVSFVMDNVESAFKHNKIPEKYNREFLLTLRGYLSSGGVLLNVCPHCLGSGRARSEE